MLLGGDDRDRLFGHGGRDSLEGEVGNDRLFGGGGRDELNGGEGRDRLSGGNGNDILTGGGGNDILTGGAGADRFRFTNQGIDTVTDFSLTDGDIFQFDSSFYPNAPLAGTDPVVGAVGVSGVNIYLVEEVSDLPGGVGSVHFAYATDDDQLLYKDSGVWSVIANTNDFGTPIEDNFEFI